MRHGEEKHKSKPESDSHCLDTVLGGSAIVDGLDESPGYV